MKKVTILGVVSVLLLSFVTTSYASIDKNLKYGQRDKEVTELQEFLIGKGLLKSTPSTFFGLLTLKAVKTYQTSIGISPTGFVGILTREKINKEIESEVASSNEAEINETGNIATQNINSVETKDLCKNIEGTQTKVPDGMFINNDSICFTPTVKQETVDKDVCKNIDGIQAKVPDNLFVGDDKYCFNPNSEVHNNSALQTESQNDLSYVNVNFMRGRAAFDVLAKYKIKNNSSKLVILSGFRMSISMFPQQKEEYITNSKFSASIKESVVSSIATPFNRDFNVKFDKPFVLLPYQEEELLISGENFNLNACQSVDLQLIEMNSSTENVKFIGFPDRQILQKPCDGNVPTFY